MAQTEEKWRIHYWVDSTPARAEFIRLILEEKGEKYEIVADKCFAYFREHKCRFGEVGYPCYAPPMLQHGDFQLAQVPIICRYLGTHFNLLPKTTHDQWHAEQVNATVHDFIAEGRLAFHGINPTASYFTQQKETQPYIDRFCSERFPVWMKHFEAALKANNNGNGFLFGDSLSYVDLGMFHLLRASESQFPDAWEKIKPDIPCLLQFKNRISNRPNIKKYLVSDRCKPFEGNSLM